MRPLEGKGAIFYDLYSAVRGPDDQSLPASLCKQVTTAVIRHIAGVYGGLADVRPLVEAHHIWRAFTSESRQTVRVWWRNNDHFREHAKHGIGALVAIPETTQEALELLEWIKTNLDTINGGV